MMIRSQTKKRGTSRRSITTKSLQKPAEIAAYYFPNYHPDPRNELQHGPGWTEWDLLRQAHPRFPGHRQPLVPKWGYENEADPKVMNRKITCAADHGIDVFLFDWYHYEDGPFLERALEQGFLKAPDRDRLKFALMWANHDWVDIHPTKASPDPLADSPILYPGKVSRKAFREMSHYIIETYFRQPNYWLIDGCPYFSVYQLPLLISGLGGVDQAAKTLQEFRAATRNAGFPDLHLNAVGLEHPILPGEKSLPADPGELLRRLGFSSFSSYVWIHHVSMPKFPVSSYEAARREYFRYWSEVIKKSDLPYLPNITMGWDSSPRTVQSDVFRPLNYPFMPTFGGNTPSRFGAAIEAGLRRVGKQRDPLRALSINAWNEWTEGSYLEPDTHYGLGYLEAIREARDRVLKA